MPPRFSFNIDLTSRCECTIRPIDVKPSLPGIMHNNKSSDEKDLVL
jgi:hypothetical protein